MVEEKENERNEKRERDEGSTGETPKDKVQRRLSSSYDGNTDVDEMEDMESSGGIRRALQSIQRQLAGQSGQLQEVVNSVQYLSQQVEDLQKDLKDTKEELKKTKQLESDVAILKQQNHFLSQRLESMENYSRRDNLLISGIKESDNEDCRALCKTFFQNTLKILKNRPRGPWY